MGQKPDVNAETILNELKSVTKAYFKDLTDREDRLTNAIAQLGQRHSDKAKLEEKEKELQKIKTIRFCEQIF